MKQGEFDSTFEQLDELEQAGKYEKYLETLNGLVQVLQDENIWISGQLDDSVMGVEEKIIRYDTRAEVIDDIEKKVIEDKTKQESSIIEERLKYLPTYAVNGLKRDLKDWKEYEIITLKDKNKTEAVEKLNALLDQIKEELNTLPDTVRTPFEEKLSGLWYIYQSNINQFVELLEGFVKERQEEDETCREEDKNKYFYYVIDAENIQIPYNEREEVIEDLEKVIEEKIEEVVEFVENETPEETKTLLENWEKEIFERLRTKDKEWLKNNLIEVTNELKNILHTTEME